MIYKMTPAATTQYAADMRLANFKAHSDIALAQLPTQGFYLCDLLVGQFCAPMLGSFQRNMKARSVSVLRVLPSCAPLQIANKVVSFCAVFVVDLVKWAGLRANECNRDQSVDKYKFLGVIGTQHSAQITTPRRFEIKDAARERSPHVRPITLLPPTTYNAWNSPYAPKIRNFMSSLMADNRYPNFFHASAP